MLTPENQAHPQEWQRTLQHIKEYILSLLKRKKAAHDEKVKQELEEAMTATDKMDLEEKNKRKKEKEAEREDEKKTRQSPTKNK
ncbi:MAG: hypothetical protein WCJ81_08450 [bacterium]